MPYTPIIAASDLTRLIYQKELDEIVREDSTKIDMAIASAIDEVKMYLSRYDLVKLFGDATEGTEAEFESDLLKQICVEVTCWNLVKLGNPNISYESMKDYYEKAIATLTKIQKGLADPKWPYQDNSENTAPASDQVTLISNTPRSNHY